MAQTPSFTIQLGSGKTFRANADETILEAALRQNVALVYGCKNGACSVCKGKLISGKIDDSMMRAGILSEDETKAGMILLCSTKALSDLVLEAKESDAAPAIKTLPARIEQIERIHDVAILKLKLPASERFVFKAGQYIDILMKDGNARSFSIANSPHDAASLELHIRHLRGGSFSEYVFNHLKEKEIIRFKGPMGSFTIDEQNQSPTILLASGTGFAPIQSIVEYLNYLSDSRPLTLYWGARNLSELYFHEKALNWTKTRPNFHYIPVLSEPEASDHWTGRVGLVHEAVLQDFESLASFEVYACGAPVMVEAAFNDFTKMRGLNAEQFHSDAFFSPKDLIKS